MAPIARPLWKRPFALGWGKELNLLLGRCRGGGGPVGREEILAHIGGPGCEVAARLKLNGTLTLVITFSPLETGGSKSHTLTAWTAA